MNRVRAYPTAPTGETPVVLVPPMDAETAERVAELLAALEAEEGPGEEAAA